MINVNNISKKFSGFKVLDGVNCNVREGSVYGLVGVNGAGKSTLLRIITGVIKANEGSVVIDGESVWDNPRAKSRLAFVSDEPYFDLNATLWQNMKMYKAFYKDFREEEFFLCCDRLLLNEKIKLNKMSKGQRRQSAIALALATMPNYLILDETFDGLDPIVRKTVKKLIFDRVSSENMSVVMTTHSLYELENTCDTLALLSNGKLALECDVENLKTSVFKVQYMSEFDLVPNGVEVISKAVRGSITELTVKGNREHIESAISAIKPVFYDILPLSLDEVFEYEVSRLGEIE